MILASASSIWFHRFSTTADGRICSASWIKLR
jgi:hypothetical protein